MSTVTAPVRFLSVSTPDIPSGPHELTHAEIQRRETWSLGAAQLDDDHDWEELRDRYYGLLQELRVILPGAQVLVAFLLTAPFSAHFDKLDRAGRILFGIAAISGVLSVITLLTPAVFHRVADRRYRSARLVWGIRLTVIGTFLLGVALMFALFCVTRLIYSSAMAALITVPVVAVTFGLWVVLPRMAKPNTVHEPPEPVRRR